jgi:hypothetical protein
LNRQAGSNCGKLKGDMGVVRATRRRKTDRAAARVDCEIGMAFACDAKDRDRRESAGGFGQR